MSNNMNDFLNDCNIGTLKKMANKMGINSKEYKKKDLIKTIDNMFSKKPDNSRSRTKRSILTPVGSGKEATTYESKRGSKLTAIKQFRKTKSPVRITSEAEFQKMASEKGISPKILKYDLDAKKIEMEKLDRTLLDILKSSNGRISQKYQKRIIEIFRILDELEIFHADPNVLNFMEKDKQLYIIDFGFAKKITSRLAKKHGTKNLNMEYMTTGLYIKLKELCPNGNFDIIKDAVPETKKFVISNLN